MPSACLSLPSDGRSGDRAARREVIVVSGPPGSGKTSVSASLAAVAERGVHLESDWFYQCIASGFVGPHLPAARAQNTAVVDLATDAAASYAEAGYRVYWDGVVGPWWIDRIARRLAARGLQLRYLVLRPDRATALARVRARDGTTETSGAETMYDQFVDLADFEAHVVASDGPIDQVIAASRFALADEASIVRSAAWVEDRWPVSVKAILGWNGRYVVVRNDRDEWELPGGRLDATDPSPEAAVCREVREEVGVTATATNLVDSWVYEVGHRQVLILVYACEAPEPERFILSDEHTAVAVMTAADLAGEALPPGYLQSIGRYEQQSALHQTVPRPPQTGA